MSTHNSTKEQQEDEATQEKVWAIYADEANNYDSALVKSWKEDMDALLVFVSLVFLNISSSS